MNYQTHECWGEEELQWRRDSKTLREEVKGKTMLREMREQVAR
jgi:hypothetical protein